MKYLPILCLLLLPSCLVTQGDLDRVSNALSDALVSGATAEEGVAEAIRTIEAVKKDVEGRGWNATEIALAIAGVVTGTGTLSVGATNVLRDRKRKLRNEPTAIPPRTAPPA